MYMLILYLTILIKMCIAAFFLKKTHIEFNSEDTQHQEENTDWEQASSRLKYVTLHEEQPCCGGDWTASVSLGTHHINLYLFFFISHQRSSRPSGRAASVTATEKAVWNSCQNGSASTSHLHPVSTAQPHLSSPSQCCVCAAGT